MVKIFRKKIIQFGQSLALINLAAYFQVFVLIETEQQLHQKLSNSCHNRIFNCTITDVTASSPVYTITGGPIQPASFLDNVELFLEQLKSDMWSRNGNSRMNYIKTNFLKSNGMDSTYHCRD